MALFGPKMAYKGRKPQYIHIFWVEKTDFGNIKLIFGTKIQFWDIIMLIYAENEPKWAILGHFTHKLA